MKTPLRLNAGIEPHTLYNLSSLSLWAFRESWILAAWEGQAVMDASPKLSMLLPRSPVFSPVFTRPVCRGVRGSLSTTEVKAI